MEGTDRKWLSATCAAVVLEKSVYIQQTWKQVETRILLGRPRVLLITECDHIVFGGMIWYGSCCLREGCPVNMCLLRNKHCLNFLKKTCSSSLSPVGRPKRRFTFRIRVAT